jgi:diguanylate cyclase (GGDEF)-like protein
VIREELKSQFTVFVFAHDEQFLAKAKAELLQSSYECFVFNDQQTLMSRVAEADPHIVVADLESLEGTLSEFVDSVLTFNEETQFLLVASKPQLQALKEYREYNLFSVIEKDNPHFFQYLVWQIDSCAEQLYLKAVTLQILTQKNQLEERIADLEHKLKSITSENSKLRGDSERKSVESMVGSYKSIESREDLVMQFFSQLNDVGSIYFKFLPTVQSFIATYSLGVDLETIKGVGARLTSEESQHLESLVHEDFCPQALHPVLKEGLGLKNYLVKCLRGPAGLDGLMVFWDRQSTADSQVFKKMIARVSDEFSIFHLVYQISAYQQKVQSVDFLDHLTGLHNRQMYESKLSEEISRARRLKHPLSVIKLSIDQFDDLETKLGRFNRDVIIKALSQLIVKTSRVNDICCRTDENEFSLILPHSPIQGAALRAERLRRIIEAHSFSVTSLRVLVSCGVCEYPTLARGSDELDQGAWQALSFIQQKNGNKVCVYKPTEKFLPDFEVSSV